jgi:carboxyl-terminal processing protease
VQTYNVFVKDLGQGYFSLIVEDFGSMQTPDRIRAAIASTIDRAKGYVVDVRNNGGGLVHSGVWSTELFIRDGLIISDRERQYAQRPTTDPLKMSYICNRWTVGQKTVISQTDDDGSNQSVQEEERQPYSVRGKPVVVLMNGGTASAAEIFTSALQGNQRSGDLAQGATIVGDDSFGKGIGQDNSAGPHGTKVRVTSLHYFTHNGEWLGDGHKHRHPLKPDVKVGNATGAMFYTSEDKQLQAAKAELKRQVGE